VVRGTKDRQSVTADWSHVRPVIDGVTVFEMKNVLGTHARTTEMFRPEWEPSGLPVAHVYQVTLLPGNSPEWHCHHDMLDRLFFGTGHVKLVLFDARAESPTHGVINEFVFGEARPALVAIPPFVWHAVQSRGDRPGIVINLASHPYCYDDPDHYRLPPNTEEIPYVWK
jgi:dTDP-4-dehydrorhamnose 3,5-epimerase